MKLNKKQNEILEKIFSNLAQVTFITIVIGKLAAPERISTVSVIVGIIIFFIFVIVAIYFGRGE